MVNAIVVLPLLGEGIAEAQLLTIGGMAAFACAHTVFFIILAHIHAALSVGLTPQATAR